VLGTTVATANAAIAVGQRLEVDAAGNVGPWVSPNVAVAVALEAAAAAGATIEVSLIPN